MKMIKPFSGVWCFALLWSVSAMGEQNPLVSPAAPEATPNAMETKAVLLPEGYWIDGRVAKLVKHPDQPRWFLMFERSKPPEPQGSLSANPAASQENKPVEFLSPDPADPFSVPIEVLPGKALASMDMITNQQTDLSLDFRIWGEVMVYHNRNYIFPNQVATLSLFGQRSAAAQGPAESPLEALEQSNSSGGEIKPGEDDRSITPSPLPPALRDLLLQMPRTYPVEWSEKTEPSAAASASASSGAAIRHDPQSKAAPVSPVRWKDGDMIIDRIGRLLFDPTEKKWLFALEADGSSLAEPPLIVQPGRLLETMESMHRDSMDTVQFRISGQIGKYQGRYYLLLRKTLTTKSLGNFGR